MKQKHQTSYNPQEFREGMRDGIPIALAYAAVSFSLGIAAQASGLSVLQGFLISLFNNASAGEYAAFTVIAAGGSLAELALVTLIANARYLLMSCSLSQHVSPTLPLHHRLLLAFDLTDELFGIDIARKSTLNPWYHYGAMAVALPCWACGTALGIAVGNLVPTQVAQALAMSLFGMFLAIIIPPARTHRPVGIVVGASFILSAVCAVLPLIQSWSSGAKTIVLTPLVAGVAALIFPVSDEREEQ